MATDEIRIKKIHTFLDLAVSAAVLAAGIGLYFVLRGWGILFCFIGILLLAFYKRGCKRVGEGTLLKEKTLDISLDCRPSIIAYLEGKGEDLEIKSQEDGDHLFLEVFYNADAAVAYARLYDVIESSFDPATEIVELRGEKARTLIDKL